MSRKWTKAEERFLRENRKKMSVAGIGRKLTISTSEIRKKLKELGLEKNESPKKPRQVRKPVRRAVTPPSRASKSKKRGNRKLPDTESERYARALALFDHGVELFNSKKFERARKVFEEIVQKLSDEREFMDRAHLYLNLIEKQLKPSEPKPRDFEDYYSQAVYQLNLGDYDKALNYLKKAREKKPNDASITYFLALVFAGKEDPRASIEYLRQAISMDVENRVLARNESEFQPFMEDPEFRELLFPKRNRDEGVGTV